MAPEREEEEMSRTYGHKRNWFGCVKKGVKSGCRTNSRADAKHKLSQIAKNVEKADEIVFYRFQDYDDHWNYD